MSTPNRAPGGAGASPNMSMSPQQMAHMLAQMAANQQAQGGQGGPAAGGGGGGAPPGAGAPSPQQLAAMQMQQQSLAIQSDKKLMHNAIMSRFALFLNDIPTITKILEPESEGGSGYDVNHQNPPPLTFPPLLAVACMTGNTKILSLLLEKKPNLGIAFNLQRRKVTLLHMAILFGFSKAAKMLIEAGMKPLVLGNPNNLQGAELPLFTACATGNTELVRFFVEELGAETANHLSYAPPPGSPPPPFLQSMPRDAIYACCVGHRPYLGDMMDLLEVVFSRAIEGVQGISVPPAAYPSWPKGAEPAIVAMSTTPDMLDTAITATRPNYKAVLGLLLDKYGLGAIKGPDPDATPLPAEVTSKPGFVNLKEPFPAAKWHDYARVAAQHANKEAVEFFFERGLLNTPLPAHVAVSAPGGPAPPALAILEDAGADVKMEAVGGSVLGVSLVGSLGYPITALESLHTFMVRIASRPPNTFRLQTLMPCVATITRQVLSMPSDVAQICAMVARHAGAVEADKRKEEGKNAGAGASPAPAIHSRYMNALKAQCLHVMMFLSNVQRQRGQAAPHYEAENKAKSMDFFIIQACESVANKFATSLSAMQEFAKKDKKMQAILDSASRDYHRMLAELKAKAAGSDGDDEEEKACKEDEVTFLSLLDPTAPMDQGRFTAICHSIASNQRKNTKSNNRWRKAVWGPEPVFCNGDNNSAAAKASGSSSKPSSASAFCDTDAAAIEADNNGPFAKIFKVPGLDSEPSPSSSSSSSSAAAGAGGAGGGLFKSALNLIKETTGGGVSGGNGDDDGDSGDFSKLVARQIMVRELSQQFTQLIYHYHNPHTLSLAASLYQAAEDVCSPDFWGAPPPASVVKNEKGEVAIEDIPMPKGAAAHHLMAVVEKAFAAGFRSGPFFPAPDAASASTAAATAAAASSAAGAGAASSSSAPAAAASPSAEDDEDQLLLEALSGVASSSSSSSSTAAAKKAAGAGGGSGKASASGGKAGAASGGPCGDAWFPASLAAAALAAAWIVASGWMTAASGGGGGGAS